MEVMWTPSLGPRHAIFELVFREAARGVFVASIYSRLKSIWERESDDPYKIRIRSRSVVAQCAALRRPLQGRRAAVDSSGSLSSDALHPLLRGAGQLEGHRWMAGRFGRRIGPALTPTHEPTKRRSRI